MAFTRQVASLRRIRLRENDSDGVLHVNCWGTVPGVGPTIMLLYRNESLRGEPLPFGVGQLLDNVVELSIRQAIDGDERQKARPRFVPHTRRLPPFSGTSCGSSVSAAHTPILQYNSAGQTRDTVFETIHKIDNVT